MKGLTDSQKATVVEEFLGRVEIHSAQQREKIWENYDGDSHEGVRSRDSLLADVFGASIRAVLHEMKTEAAPEAGSGKMS